MSEHANAAAAFLAITAATSSMAAENNTVAYQDQERVQIVQMAEASKTPKLDAVIKEMGCKECVIRQPSDSGFVASYNIDQNKIYLDPRLEETTSKDGLRFLVAHEQAHGVDFAARPNLEEKYQTETISKFFERASPGELGSIKKLASDGEIEQAKAKMTSFVETRLTKVEIDAVSSGVKNINHDREYTADRIAAERLAGMGVNPSVAIRESLDGAGKAYEAKGMWALTGETQSHPSHADRFAAVDTGRQFVVEDRQMER